MRGENIAAAYSHLFDPSWLLNANVWWRGDHVDYYPSLDAFADQPATFSQNRSLVNLGARADLSFSKKHHNVKAGFLAQWTPLDEAFTTGLTDPGFNSPCVDHSGVPVPDRTLLLPAVCTADGFLPNPAFEPSLLQYDLTRGGDLFRFQGAATIWEQSAYFQDAMNFGRLGVNLGIREDRYDGISHRSELQPRTGLTYQLPYSGTVLRVSYARVMVTPYNENLVLSSATGAGGLAGGALGSATVMPLTPGRRNQFNARNGQSLGKQSPSMASIFGSSRTAHSTSMSSSPRRKFPFQFRKEKIDGAMPGHTRAAAWLLGLPILGHIHARLFRPVMAGSIGTQRCASPA